MEPRWEFSDVGTGIGGLTRRTVPLLEDMLEGYVCSDIFDIMLGSLRKHPAMSRCKYGVNTTISELKTFHLVLAASAIHIVMNVNESSLERLYDALEEDDMVLLEEAVS